MTATTTPPPLCFVDTETTSLLDTRRAWEFAAIRIEGDGREMREEFFIDVPLNEADPASLGFGKFYERHPWAFRKRDGIVINYSIPGSAPSGPRVWPEAIAVRKILEITHGAVLVGSNPAFDAATLAPLLRRHGLIESWHYAVRDIVPLVAGFLRGKGLAAASWKSEELSRAVGVDPDQYARHTAMGDCEWTRAVYEAVMSA